MDLDEAIREVLEQLTDGELELEEALEQILLLCERD
jgi:hypothetical protein